MNAVVYCLSTSFVRVVSVLIFDATFFRRCPNPAMLLGISGLYKIYNTLFSLVTLIALLMLLSAVSAMPFL
jgi:hypothetical protein